MSNNQIEFIIKRDAAQNDIELDNMSLEAAKALVVILNSITEIIELTPDNSDLKVQITSGSAVVAASGTESQIRLIERNFEEVVHNKSKNKELVKKWRAIQTLFLKNGIQYEANLRFGNQSPTSIITYLKQPKPYRTATSREPLHINIEFLKGKLIAVGGKKPNIHIEIQDKRYTISCSETQAKNAQRYLYDEILLSTWTRNTRGKNEYEFCDVYGNPNVYEDFKAYINEFKNGVDDIEVLESLHYQIRKYLIAKDYINAKKFIKLFNHNSTDINTLKTILIATQSFKENDQIGKERKKMKEIFEKSINKL